MRERGSQVAAGVHEGDVLDGKYQVDRVLGAGGMGIVVAAHHLQLDTKVALKFLTADTLASEEALGRFEREARAAAKISSLHVARVMDVGELENGSPYMVMELLEGSDLAQRLQESGPFPIDLAVELILQACEAIAEAHHLGIVHRDLKPANLFCIQQADGLPHIKVLDFGISKFARGGSRPEMAMTRTATTMGSPLYMSPEQMESAREVDPRTDIWSLGVIAHELIAGEPPFHGTTLPEVCLKIATRSPPPLRTLRADVPARLEAAVLRCLEKDREKRYPDVAAFAAALLPFGPERSRVSLERIARMVRPIGEATLAAPDATAVHGAGTNLRGRFQNETVTALGNTKDEYSIQLAPSRRRAATLIAVLAGLASVLGVSVFAFERSTRTSTGGSPPDRAAAAAAASSIAIAPAAPAPTPESLSPLRPEAPVEPPATETGAIPLPPPHSHSPSRKMMPASASSSRSAPAAPGGPPVVPIPKEAIRPREADPFSGLQPL